MAFPLSSVFRRRWPRWCLASFAVLSLAGFLVAPLVVKRQLVKHASAALKRPVTVGAVRVNPWALSLTIRGLSVKDHDGAELAGWDEFYANLEASSLVRGEFHFAEIRFVRPRGRIVVHADGSLNVADLAPPAGTPAAPPAKPPAVGVALFLVERGEFDFEDRSRSGKFATHLGPSTFELKDFTTRPKRAGAYTFAATTESGERVAWQGSVTFDPLGSAGRVGIFDVNLPKYSPFHRDLHGLDVADGKLSLEGDYEIELGGAAPAVRLGHGSAKLENLKLAARGASEPFLVLPLVQVEGVAADTTKREAAIGAVLVRGANVAAVRRADGSIDLQDWLTPKLPAAPAAAAASPAAPAAPAPAWSATLGRLAVENATVRLTDLTNPRPANLVIDRLGVTLTGAGTQLDRPVQLATHLRVNERGTVDVAGTVRPQPLAADLTLDVAGVELRPLDPYVAPFLNVLVTGGAVRAKGKLTAALAADGPPQAHFEGDVGLAEFATVDAALSEPFVGVADVAVKQLRFDLSPLAVQIEEIAVQQPFARVVIAADGRINLLAALKKNAAAAPAVAGATKPAAPAVPAKSPPPPVRIGRVTIEGARFALADASVSPAFATELHEFGGTIAGLSSEQLARADVDLAGKLGFAPLRVTGKINPLSGDAFTDLKVTFTGIELPPFTPYSGKFAGYTIDKGKVSIDLGYKLSARELTGENKVVLDQFYLGSSVESPDAIKLPLKLALAILRDRDGRIVIDIPVRGNLDDPDFRYGAFVWHAVGNLITKAATAPFALLGGLFGGGKDLSAVEFAGGSAELNADAVARLDGLVKALTERPALNLEIDSRPQPGFDEPAVREAKLFAQLKARKVRALAQTTTENVAAETVTLAPDETERLTAELFAETFPETAAPAAAVSPAPAAAGASPAASAPAAPGNPVTRTVRRVGGGAKTARSTVVTTAAPGTAPAATAAPAGGASTGGAAGIPATPVAASGPPPAEQRARLLAKLEVAPADFAALAARRAQAIQEYLQTAGKVDAARLFIAANGETAAAADTKGAAPRVVFTLK